MRLFFLGCVFAMSAAFANMAAAALPLYVQDFEGMTAAENVIPNTFSADGWLVGANVFNSTGAAFQYGYFAFPAPNGGPAFSGVVTGEGGPSQGLNQLSVYNDYNNGDHGNASGNRIEANIFRDIGILAADDVGQTYYFSFDGKQGNIAGSSTATAFMKVIKTSDSSFAQLAIDSANTTALGTNWTAGLLSIAIDAAWVGETLQIGFTNTASNFEASGNFYDNLRVANNIAAVPEPSGLAALGLGMSILAIRRRQR